MEIGFAPGSSVVFLMPTPFADPLLYALRGATIALRRSDAERIRVRL